MMKGQLNIAGDVNRTSSVLGSPLASRPTRVLVSSDRRTDRLISARGKSTSQEPLL
jgi:hypothetical protein